MRLLTSTDTRSSWAAHSVDPVDVPAFFTGYTGPALPVWLESLSQASNGEYPADAGTSIAAHTDAVREALATHRLLLANHALLLAHRDDLGSLGDDTLLIVDEAHQLEDAATSALTTTVDYRTVEDLFSELSAWTDSERSSAERDAVREAIDNLGLLLDHEQLPRVAGQAFDARGTGVGVVVGSRTVTLASAYAGSAGVGQVRTLTGLLLRLAGQCEALVGSLSAYLDVHGSVLDFFEVERVRALLTRCAQVKEAGRTIVADVNGILGPPPAISASGRSGAGTGGGTSRFDSDRNDPTAGSDGTSDDPADDMTDDGADDIDDDLSSDDGTGDEAGEGVTSTAVPLGMLPPGTSNQVVYAEELEALRAGLRSYRFRIATSPVELAADATWQQFLATFARTYYVSATLRVSGRWQFIRDRLVLQGSASACLRSDRDRVC